jgi:hypothetical protein
MRNLAGIGEKDNASRRRFQLEDAWPLASLSLIALVACSTGDCTKPEADIPPEKLAQWIASELEVPAVSRDLIVGSGRVAQMDRRLFLFVSMRTADGGLLGEGTMTLEYPQWEAVGTSIRRRSTPVQRRLLGALAGMREKGEREFIWRSDLRHPQECDPRDGMCRFWLGGQLITYPPGQDILFRVGLERLCEPRYCVVTSYSIPIIVNHRLEEQSCR